MAKLEEYLGGLVDGLAQARLMADLRAAETARIYAKHELLKAMSVPRMRFGTVEMTIPLAVERAQELPKPLPVKRVNPDLLERKIIESQAENFGSGQVTVTLTRTLQPAIRRHDSILVAPNDTPVTHEAARKFSRALTQNISRLVATGRLKPRADWPFDDARTEKQLLGVVEELGITGESRPPLTDETEVIYEASRLREMRPDDITRIRLIVEEDSMEWHQIERDDGSVENKLLPE